MENLLKIVKELRGENGCPWDKKQNLISMSKYLMEETCEVIDAITENNEENICEELGDLLLVISMMTQILSESADIKYADVEKGIVDKIIRRHPHVFGNETVKDADEVLKKWDEIKQGEENKPLFFEKVSKSMPPLELMLKLQEDASNYGFDWVDKEPVIEKVREEFEEFIESTKDENAEEMKAEFGDILFSLVNVSRFLDINPLEAARNGNNKFVSRLLYINSAAKKEGRDFKDLSFEEMDVYWDKAKLEKKNGCQ